jgi:hypothetical protein
VRLTPNEAAPRSELDARELDYLGAASRLALARMSPGCVATFYKGGEGTLGGSRQKA